MTVHPLARAPSGTPDAALASVLRAVDAARDDLVAFVQRLVRIPSLPGREHDAHRLVADRLRGLGLAVEIVPCETEPLASHPAYSDDGLSQGEPRINVVARWSGAGHPAGRAAGRSLILNGHLDVVSPGNEAMWQESPWSGRVEGGRILGRGACDMKAGVACAVFAVAALRAAGLRLAADLLVETVSGEESGGIGTLTTIVKGYTADAAIVLEPTRMRICPVQSGALTFRLRVRGRSTHACMKSRGVSAIEKACYLLSAIEALDRRRHGAGRHPLYEDPRNVAPISIGTIRGGDWHSTVPNEAVLEGRLGVFPGESIAEAKAALLAAIAAAADGDPWLSATRPEVEWFEGQFEAAETPLDAPLLSVLGASHRAVAGEAPALAGVTYGSDLRFFTNHLKIPAVLYGPGDVADAHTVNESVAIDDVVLATKVIAHAIVSWCGVEVA
ncbi:MAG: ArgE/DapE family deacylase [Gemmatimonadaceae bacterium]